MVHSMLYQVNFPGTHMHILPPLHFLFCRSYAANGVIVSASAALLLRCYYCTVTCLFPYAFVSGRSCFCFQSSMMYNSIHCCCYRCYCYMVSNLGKKYKYGGPWSCPSLSHH